MTRKAVTFDRFEGGEYGLLGGSQAPPHSFTGRNVVRLIDGSLCPRSGLVDLAPTGVPVGKVLGFGYNALNNRIWFVVGNKVYDFAITGSLSQAVRTDTGAFAITPTTRLMKGAEAGNYTYVTLYGDKSYSIEHAGGTLGALTNSPGGRCIAKYNDRLLVASASGAPNRVYFSAAADFNSWPVANYFDVGYLETDIVYMAPFRERVVFGLADGTWWLYTGTPGVNDVLRRMVRSVRPGSATSGPTRATESGDGRVWFAGEGEEVPTVFSGSNIEAQRHLSMTSGVYDSINDTSFPPPVGATGLSLPADVFLFATSSIPGDYDNRGRLFTDGVWTAHGFGQTLSGWVDGRNVSVRRMYFSDGGSADTSAKFYAWHYGLTRPPNANYTYEALDDVSSSLGATFTLPEWWAKDGSEVAVQTAFVDFTKYDHGYDTDNGFALSVTPLSRYNTTDGAAASGTWSEDPGSSTTAGIRARQRIDLKTANLKPAQFGNGFQVSVSAMVGVAIHRVHVVYDERPMQAV